MTIKTWLILTLLSLFVLPMTTPAQDAGADPIDPASDGVSVTIYNEGTALIRDRRTFAFGEGLTQIDFTDVASSIDPTSVSFISLTAPDETTVLEQNYIYDLVGSEALFSRYLDQEIRLTMSDGTEYTGNLLSARNGSVIIQRPRDNSVVMLQIASARDVRFPSLPDGLITRPTLRWLVNTPAAGNQQVELTYLTGGINWTADYNVLLNVNNTALDLNGWVTLNNHSGTAYADAQVKLIAGDVNRVQPDVVAFEEEMMLRAAPMAADGAGGGATQREFSEYQLYELNRRVTVGNNETKQVEFVSGNAVPAKTFFVYDASSPYFYGYGYANNDSGYGSTGITDIQNYLEFTTDEADGLGADLPAGRIRVYQQDIDGAALLIGENRIDHTPQGETVQIYLGNAFDLVGERTQTDFRMVSRSVYTETFEIKLRNRKDDETVEIRVPEKLYRWRNWEIIESSEEFEQLDSSTIEFRVNVEPDEERTITYTVQYVFPD